MTAPALVVAGSKDKAGVVAAQALAAELPDSRVEVIPGAGALLNTDSARELAALTHAFLDLPASG